MQPMTENDRSQSVRAKYRSRTENKLAGFQLAAMLMQRKPAQSINVVSIDAATLVAIAKRIESLAVKSCNIGLTERDEKRWENLKAEAVAIAAGYGLTVSAHGDPRGFVVRLHGDGIWQNGWGAGFGVA